MSPLSRLLSNTGFSVFADLFNRLANTLLFILISRLLGVSAAGTFSLALSYFLIGSRFSFWGLDHLLTRDVARDREAAGRYVVNFVLLRVGLALLSIAGIALLVWQLPYAPATRVTILLLALSILPENITNICQAVYLAYERLVYLPPVSLVGSVLKLGLSGLLLWQTGRVEGVALAFTMGSFVTMALHITVVLTRFVRPRWTVDAAFCLAQLRVAFPFIFIGMFFILDNRIDVVLLSLLSDEEAVGLYSAAVTVLTALAMVPQGIQNAAYPLLARVQSRQPDELPPLTDRLLKYLALLAVPMALGVMLVADQIVALVFGPAFTASVPVLAIAIWTLLFYALTVLHTRLLIVFDRQALIARFLLVSLAATVVLNVLLVPRFGAVGAALVRVATAALLFGLNEWAVRRLVPGRRALWRLLARPLLAGAIMGGVALLLRPFGLWVVIPLAATAYGVTLLALGTFPPEEQRLWRQTLTAPLKIKRERFTNG